MIHWSEKLQTIRICFLHAIWCRLLRVPFLNTVQLLQLCILPAVQTLRHPHKIVFRVLRVENVNLAECTTSFVPFCVYRPFCFILSVYIMQQTFANICNFFLTSSYCTLHEIMPVGKIILALNVEDIVLWFNFHWFGLGFYLRIM